MFKSLLIAVILSVFMVSVASAAAVRLNVKSVYLSKTGGIATDSYIKYRVTALECSDEAKTLNNETSVMVGGNQVYVLHKAVCEEVNQTVNQ